MAEMRRADRRIDDDAELRGILERCHVMRVGFADAEGPFIMPVNYGYVWRGLADPVPLTLYAHSAPKGRKARALARGGSAAIEIDEPLGAVSGRTACAWAFAYRSVMGVGALRTLSDDDEVLITLMTIYDKSDIENVSDAYLRSLVQQIESPKK